MESITRQAFRELSDQGALVPVYRELPADLETPVSVYLKLRGQGASFLLESVEKAEQAAKVLTTITSAINTINDMNTQIASAAEQQGAVAQEIDRNVTSIHQVANETSEGAVRTASASDNLARLAIELQEMVGHFKV